MEEYVKGTPEEEAIKEQEAHKLQKIYEQCSLDDPKEAIIAAQLKKQIADLGGLTYGMRTEAAKNPLEDE